MNRYDGISGVMSKLTACLVFGAALLAGTLAGAQTAPSPFETETWATAPNAVDAPVVATLKKQGLSLAKPCSDAVFVRRVFIDVIGTLPTPQEVQRFMQDPRPDKRAVLIDSLLSRDEFADFWALKWCDILRVKSEFPINLWPNAVQTYHRWIHDSLRDGKPYDQFARELLTASGSNFRVAPANFYRAIQGRDPGAISRAVALTFMCTRLENWPDAKRTQFANLFSRVAYKKTGEWKEEIVYLDPAASGPLKGVLPDGTALTVPANQDPREAFADWLITPANPWFDRALCNRAWYWLMGHGVIHEPDDIRTDNPPACPELLTVLEKELVASHYDLRQVFRLILNSRTYQQSSVQTGAPAPKATFARYQVRRLDAEVLADALAWIGGSGEELSSPIPEPFSWIPKENRAITLADGSITSQFLETFGKPTRDTGLESERGNTCSDAQRLYLLNSTEMRQKVESSPLLRELVAKSKPADVIPGVYLIVLSRPPTDAELATAQKYFQTSKLPGRQAVNDLAWSLINGKEFLYRH